MSAVPAPAIQTTPAARREPPRCAACGEVIGIYEPLLVASDRARRRQTSLAAEPDLIGTDLRCYHRECAGAAPVPA